VVGHNVVLALAWTETLQQMRVKGSQKAECGLFGLIGLFSETFVSDVGGIISRDGDGCNGRTAQIRSFANSH
jgi:hypothetical protein